MHYHLVYDVLNDGFPWFGIAFAVLLSLFTFACLIEIRERLRGNSEPRIRTPGRASMRDLPLAAVVGFTLLMLCFTTLLARDTYDGYSQRLRCREWAQDHQFQVTEGTISDYEYRKAGPRFSVANMVFDMANRSAAFSGRFNFPAHEESLRNGLHVRLAHRDGYILRIELASESASVAGRP